MTLAEFLLARLDDEETAAWRTPTHIPDLTAVAAKRAMMRLHGQIAAHGDPRGTPDGICGTDLEDYPCQTLRLLVSMYASHPDYDEAWRA